MTGSKSDFEHKFLEQYLAVGIGALSKKDTETLVMHLLDSYGGGPHGPLGSYSNQDVSALLKVPVNKIRQLRYEAGLKYGGRVEDQAMARLLVALSKAVLEPDDKKICLIIEDALAKNWLQGQLKANGLIFDHSFNTEIVKVDADGLFKVLGQFFDSASTSSFKGKYDQLVAANDREKLRQGFVKLAKDFASGAAKVAGGAVAAHFKQYLPLL